MEQRNSKHEQNKKTHKQMIITLAIRKLSYMCVTSNICEIYMSGTMHPCALFSFNYFPDNYPITHNYSEKNAMIRLSHANIISSWILLSNHEHVHIFELRVLNYTRGKVMALECNLSPALLYRSFVVSHSSRHKRKDTIR